jgi:hypothetical protein
MRRTFGRLESTPDPRRDEHLHAPYIWVVGIDSVGRSEGDHIWETRSKGEIVPRRTEAAHIAVDA